MLFLFHKNFDNKIGIKNMAIINVSKTKPRACIVCVNKSYMSYANDLNLALCNFLN